MNPTAPPPSPSLSLFPSLSPSLSPSAPAALSPEHPDPALAAAEHRRAWDAIPWVVAGAASNDDRSWVRAHLPQCRECQAEWGLQQRVHAGLNAAEPSLCPDPTPALHRLLARLDAGAAADDAAASGLGLARVPQPAAWTRWLAAAVVVQAIGLGAAGMALFDRHSSGSGDPGEFRTLSQADAPAPAASVRLVLAPGMDFSTLRLLLAQTRMVAVEVGADGNSLGLAAADGDPGTAKAALPILRAAAAVMLAEPVASRR